MAELIEDGPTSPDVQITKTTLQAVVTECQKGDVVALAIDAQLTFSISRENGFRASDENLREMLPSDFRNRVASYNSLMAVPLRGTALAAAASPFVGTIIETHPTACLALEFADADARRWVTDYKSPKPREGQDQMEWLAVSSNACQSLWDRWLERFRLRSSRRGAQEDGPVDALVTATVAWLYHRAPERLQRLAVGESDEVGRGPFWVIQPAG